MNRLRTSTLGLAATLLVAGCGSGNETTTVTERISDSGKATTATTTPAATTTAADRARRDGCIKVPNVVGKDHQLAQDTMQAAGLYFLDEKDATGKGRLLVLDRNWVDVRQAPRAGSCVAPDTRITLYAKKDHE